MIGWLECCTATNQDVYPGSCPTCPWIIMVSRATLSHVMNENLVCNISRCHSTIFCLSVPVVSLQFFLKVENAKSTSIWFGSMTLTSIPLWLNVNLCIFMVQTLTLWLTVALNENLLQENMLLSLMMEIKVAPNESYKLGWIKDNAIKSNVFLSLSHAFHFFRQRAHSLRILECHLSLFLPLSCCHYLPWVGLSILGQATVSLSHSRAAAGRLPVQIVYQWSPALSSLCEALRIPLGIGAVQEHCNSHEGVLIDWDGEAECPWLHLSDCLMDFLLCADLVESRE